MKRIILCFVLTLMILIPAFSDVQKRTKSEVSFKGFGTFKSDQRAIITADRKLTDSKNEFKGKGIMGRLAGKFALKSGEEAELIDLAARTICSMDRKKKEYSIQPITVLETGDEAAENSETGEAPETGEMDSSIRIIRSEFKVEETGETKTLHKFPSSKYLVTWITEWEDTESGQKGTDRLLTDVWTSPLTGDPAQAREEEDRFTQQHMSLLGLDYETLKQSILGTNWLQALSGLSGESPRTRGSDSRMAEELQKIEGYPVVIEGKYYALREGGEDVQEEEGGADVRKSLGRFAKKTLLGGKKKDADEPNLAFKTEVVELKTGGVDAKDFEIPADYKEKK